MPSLDLLVQHSQVHQELDLPVIKSLGDDEATMQSKVDFISMFMECILMRLTKRAQAIVHRNHYDIFAKQEFWIEIFFGIATDNKRSAVDPYHNWFQYDWFNVVCINGKLKTILCSDWFLYQ